MVVGLAITSTVTAIVTATLTKQDRLQQDLDDRKRLMSSMLSYYEVPWALQKDVIRAFPTVLDAHSSKAFQEMVGVLPEAIRVQVQGYTNLRLLRKVALFDRVDQQHALAIANCLSQRFAAAGEPIITKGDDGDEMYFLINGVVDVIIEPSAGPPVVVATLSDGTYFGEMALLERKPRMAHIVAKTLTELLVLTRDDFDGVVRNIPDVFDAFRRDVFKRIVEVRRMSMSMSSFPRRPPPGTVVLTSAQGK
jgi:hypothetical protein